MPFKEPTEGLYAQYFPRGWNRLEGRSRTDDFSSGLRVTTADPLWALGRQWQLLELKGVDGGSPIQVELTREVATLNRVRLGNQQFNDLPSDPVEVLVEREAVDWDWRMRVRAGQHVERLVRLDPTVSDAKTVIDDLRILCPIARPQPDSQEWVDLDLASRRFVALMEGRSIDGQRLLKRIKDGQSLPGVSAALQLKISDWYKALYSQDPDPNRISPAWQPSQLDYDFRLHASNTDVPGPLHAASYRNGTIDWHTFVLAKSNPEGFEQKAPVQLTPVHVTFAGQPMRRWWEFEDGAVNLGALDTAKTDLGKLALMEFAIVFGDDWFVVPVTAGPNTLMRVRKLRVRDCFGQFTEIPHARDPSTDPLKRWEVFALAPESPDGKAGDFLYVPPIAGFREESPVLEEIRFARDEDANAVFAIEHTVPNKVSEPAGGFAAHLEQLRRQRGASGASAATETSGEAGGEAPGVTAPSPAKIVYALTTSAPANWIPFIATDSLNVSDSLPQHSVKLQRAAMVSPEGGNAQQVILGLSRLLSPSESNAVNWIEEHAVGREGVRVELRRQRMRSATGNTYVWLGRKIGVGKGEARSGLAFDIVRSKTA